MLQATLHPQQANYPAASATSPNFLTHPNVLEDLQLEHVDVLRDFETFKAAAGAARKVPFARLKLKARKHMAAEEAVFYPAITALGSAEAALVTTALSEHTAIKNALTAIESAGADAASGGQVTTLETALKNHIKAERGGIFTAARKKLTPSQRRNLASLVAASEAASSLS
jgi:hypothetical protein